MKKYFKTGVNAIVGTIAVGSIPNISGTTAEADVKSGFAGGMSNIGKQLPTMGKIHGTGMVMSSVGKLQKSSKKMFKGSKF